jgi:hypothetical protein
MCGISSRVWRVSLALRACLVAYLILPVSASLVIVKYHENGGPKGGGYASLTDKEKETFRSIYRQYSRYAALQALGSAPQDTGSYSMG